MYVFKKYYFTYYRKNFNHFSLNSHLEYFILAVISTSYVRGKTLLKLFQVLHRHRWSIRVDNLVNNETSPYPYNASSSPYIQFKSTSRICSMPSRERKIRSSFPQFTYFFHSPNCIFVHNILWYNFFTTSI